MTQAELENLFGARWLSLADGRSGLRGTLKTTVKQGVQEPADTLDFTASDETLDRYDEVISAAGWQLDNYHRNPVFQNAHKYGDVMFTLGKALITQVMGGGLFQRVQFATDVNPMAKIAHGLYKGGFLNAVSVGFIPMEWENGNETTAWRRKFTKQELLEVSAVAVPANPNALVLGLKAGAIEAGDLRESLEMLRAWVGSEFIAERRARSDAPYPTTAQRDAEKEQEQEFRSGVRAAPDIDTRSALGAEGDEAHVAACQVIRLAAVFSGVLKAA